MLPKLKHCVAIMSLMIGTLVFQVEATIKDFDDLLSNPNGKRQVSTVTLMLFHKLFAKFDANRLGLTVHYHLFINFDASNIIIQQYSVFKQTHIIIPSNIYHQTSSNFI